MQPNGILDLIKIKWIFFFFFWGGGSFTFGLRNCHRGGEVKWVFFQKPLDNFLWKCGNSILMPVTLCTQKEFLIESKLNWSLGGFRLLLDLEIFIGEGRWSNVLCARYTILILNYFKGRLAVLLFIPLEFTHGGFVLVKILSQCN